MLGRENNTSMAPGESRHAEATGERGFPYYLTRVHVGMSGFPHTKNICLSFTSQIPACDCDHGFVHFPPIIATKRGPAVMEIWVPMFNILISCIIVVHLNTLLTLYCAAFTLRSYVIKHETHKKH